MMTEDLEDLSADDNKKYNSQLIGNRIGSNTTSIAPLQSPADTQRQTLIGNLNRPFQSLDRNWSTLKSDFSDPNTSWLRRGVDVYSMAKNPVGNWGNRGISPQAPQLTDEHLGQPNSNGLRPINDKGFKVIDSSINSTPIPDNSSVINSTMHAGSGIPTVQSNPVAKGWVGKIVDNYFGLGSNTQYA